MFILKTTLLICQCLSSCKFNESSTLGIGTLLFLISLDTYNVTKITLTKLKSSSNIKIYFVSGISMTKSSYTEARLSFRDELKTVSAFYV